MNVLLCCIFAFLWFRNWFNILTKQSHYTLVFDRLVVSLLPFLLHAFLTDMHLERLNLIMLPFYRHHAQVLKMRWKEITRIFVYFMHLLLVFRLSYKHLLCHKSYLAHIAVYVIYYIQFFMSIKCTC